MIHKTFSYPQEHTQTCDVVVLKTFDELTVRLSLDSTNLQHRKLAIQLVKPHIPGFSYEGQEQAQAMEVIEIDDDDVPEVKDPKKRKEKTVNKGNKKKSRK